MERLQTVAAISECYKNYLLQKLLTKSMIAQFSIIRI